VSHLQGNGLLKFKTRTQGELPAVVNPVKSIVSRDKPPLHRVV
jgi:hypothetical protein